MKREMRGDGDIRYSDGRFEGAVEARGLPA